jgi:hypothetical protein
MHLVPADEYFNHQVSLPHAIVASSDPNWRERYWISIQDSRRDDFILSFGFGKYPNQDLMEGFAIATHGTVQRNLRVSRQLSGGSQAIDVGPLSAEIVEPFKTLRFHLESNPSEISFDLTWHASMPSMLEGRHFEINRARVTHDLSRYVQLGRISGHVQLPDTRLQFEPETGWGERDHSWGIRPMAGIPGEPPAASAEWNFLAFCPVQFESFAVHLYVFEMQYGRPTHLSASIVSRDEGTAEYDAISGIEHDFEWDFEAAVRTLKGGRLVIHFFEGKSKTIDIVARTPRVYLRGGGYGVDQGRWKGETHLEHERWDLSDQELLKQYAASPSDHMIEAHCDGETGFGIIEYIVRRGYRRYARKSESR